MGDRRNESATVLFYVLFADIADGHEFAVDVANGVTEDALGFKDPLGMVTEGTMSEIGEAFFGAIEPVVDGQVIVDDSAPQLDGHSGMMEWVTHREQPSE